MNYIRHKRWPAHAALVIAGAALPVLMGCQPQTIVARVNDKPITEQEFNLRVQRVQQTSFQGQPQNMDAGGLTLENMIQSILIDQCAAASVKTQPTDASVEAYFKQVLRKNPELVNGIKTGAQSEDDLKRAIKSGLERLAIGTDGAQLEDKDLQAQYDKLKSTQKLDYPTAYTLKYLVAPSKEQAASILESLRKTGNFAEAATLLGVPPDQAVNITRAVVFPADKLPPPVVKVFDTLTPNQYVPEAIELPANPSANPQASTNPGYFIGQLISKQPGSTPQLGDIRALLAQMALQEKFPQWEMHAQVRVAEFTEKANLQIMIDRYKPLVKEVILPAAKRNAAMASGEPGGMGAPGGGVPAGGAPAGSPGAGPGPAPGGQP